MFVYVHACVSACVYVHTRACVRVWERRARSTAKSQSSSTQKGVRQSTLGTSSVTWLWLNRAGDTAALFHTCVDLKVQIAVSKFAGEIGGESFDDALWYFT